VEKAPEFYLRNGFFWIKMTLFVSVFALEMWPMATFVRWRRARREGTRSLIRWSSHADRHRRRGDALVVLIPVHAAALARGLWLF